MKNLIIFLTFLKATVASAQYNFTFTCLTDTIFYLQPNDAASFRFRLTNTGTVRDSYKLLFWVVESVPGWVAQLCARGRCVGPGTPITFSLEPLAFDTATVSIYTDTQPGRKKLRVACFSLGDTTLKVFHNVYAQVGLGITKEKRRPRSLGSGRIYLYSLDGRRVFSPGRGIYFLPEKQKKVLILAK